MRGGLALALLLACAAATALGAPARRATARHNGNWNDTPYGVNGFHPNGPAPQGHLIHFTDRNIARLKEGDVRWVRLMLDWRYCEPSQGSYYWDALDRVVEKLNREHIGISACIYEPPAWALVEGTDWRVRPEYLESFGQAIAARYRDRIAAYEIENEKPTGSWPHVAERSAAVYVPMLKAAYRGIKRSDPNAVVVMTGLWEFPMYYLEDMYRLGARGFFDAVNIHYYLRMSRDPTYKDPFRGDLDLVLKQVDYVTKKYGDNTIPIWFTEFGWPATDESQAFPVGDQKMAEYLTYFEKHCMDSGLVEKAFWYVYYMPDGMALWHEREDRKRPAFYAFTGFQKEHPTWTGLPVTSLSYPKPAGKAARIPDAGFESLAAWQADAGTRLSLGSSQPHGGQRYLHLACEKPDTAVTGKPFAVEPGRAYELIGYLRMKGGLANPRYAHAMIHLELLDAKGQPLGLEGPRQGEKDDARSTNYYLSDTGGEWYQVHYAVFMPSEARQARIVLRMGNPDAPQGEADFDDVALKPLNLGAYDTTVGAK